MAHNPDADHCRRMRLSLSSDGGKGWQKIYEFGSDKAPIPKGTFATLPCRQMVRGVYGFPLPQNLKNP